MSIAWGKITINYESKKTTFHLDRLSKLLKNAQKYTKSHIHTVKDSKKVMDNIKKIKVGCA